MLSRLRGTTPQPVPVRIDNGYPMPMQPMEVPQAVPQAQARMSFDDVLTKSAICLGLVVLVAAATWTIVPAGMPTVAVALLFSLVTGIAALVISMQRHITAPLAIGYAVAEGVGMGALSKMFESYYEGIVSQAVFSTFIAAAVVFFAVKTFKIRFGERLRKVFFIAMASYAIAMLLNFVLSFAGINLGFVDAFGSVSVLGVIMCLVGTVLAVMSLMKDLGDVFAAVESGAPASESWRAAFGITFSMVWLYTEILRVLSYLDR